MTSHTKFQIRSFEPMQLYLNLLLRKNYDEVRSLSAGGAQPNLNVQKIKEVLVPLPPLAEQHRIVAKVNELMALCDRLEAQLTTTAFTRHQLLEATINQAISGRVELQQVRADEPKGLSAPCARSRSA